MDHTGWLLLTIVVPAVLPTLIAWAMYWGDWNEASRTTVHPMRTIKDGQLCWVAIAFCGSGLYENLSSHAWNPWLVSAFCLLMLLSVLWGSMGMAKPGPYPFPTPPGATRNIMIGSIVVALVSGLLFALVHFTAEIKNLR